MIPVRNLYAMLAFAWRDLALVEDSTVGACDFERPFDVAARLLDVALHRLFRRGAHLSFSTFEEVGSRPRGAIDLARTLNERTTLRNKLAYRFEDLTLDTPANQLIKGALVLLLREPTVAADQRRRLCQHVVRLAEVTSVPASALRKMAVAAPRHERAYEEALWLAGLVLNHLITDEGGVSSRSRQRDRTRQAMPAIFEGFIRGAARYFLAGSARVHAPQLQWEAAPLTAGALDLLPGMKTDVAVDWASGPTTIFECKFYETPLVAHHRDERGRLRTSHLYQLLAYLNAYPSARDRLAGVLVYAQSGEAFDVSLLLDGLPIRALAIDLEATWPALRAQIVDAVSWQPQGGLMEHAASSQASAP